MFSIKNKISLFPCCKPGKPDNSEKRTINRKLSSLFQLCAGVLMLCGIASQQAVAETYFSIDGSKLNLRTESDDEFSPGGMRFRMGSQISPLIDIEGQLGFSFSDDSERFDSLRATYLSGFLKGYIPVGTASAVYGLAGWSAFSLSQEIGNSEFTEERGGFSWGFGMETQLTRNADLTADFVNYINSDGLFESISAVNVGIKLYF